MAEEIRDRVGEELDYRTELATNSVSTSSTFLDFGCVKRFEPAQLKAMKALERAVIDDDAEALRRVFIALGFLHGKDVPSAEEVMAWYRLSYEPVLAPQPATYASGFVAEAVRRHFDPLGRRGRIVRAFVMPKDFVFLNRIFVGSTRWRAWARPPTGGRRPTNCARPRPRPGPRSCGCRRPTPATAPGCSCRCGR